MHWILCCFTKSLLPMVSITRCCEWKMDWAHKVKIECSSTKLRCKDRSVQSSPLKPNAFMARGCSGGNRTDEGFHCHRASRDTPAACPAAPPIPPAHGRPLGQCVNTPPSSACSASAHGRHQALRKIQTALSARSRCGMSCRCVILARRVCL